MAVQRAAFAWRSLALPVALFVASVVVYLPALRHEFVRFDDDAYVLENPQVGGGLGLEALRWAWRTNHGSMWQPLTWLSYQVDAQLWGLDPFGFHLTNVLLHASNSVLLFLFLSRASATSRAPAFAAAVFALHPLRVESVAWVAERKGLLAGLFWMLALLAYQRYTRRPSPGRYVWLLAAHAAGLMCKPVLVTLPFALLLLDAWPLHREFGERAWRSRLAEKLPLIAASLAGGLVAYEAQRTGGALHTLADLPLSLRLGNSIVSALTYLRAMAWPGDLAVLYPHPVDPLPVTLVAGAGLLLLAATAAALRAWPGFASTGWLWYLLVLAPTSGIVASGTHARADRFSYLPSIGIAIIVAWGAPCLLRRLGPGGRMSTLLGVAAALVLLSCAAATRSQLRHWRASIPLFERALAVTRDNYLIHHELGVELDARGRTPEALEQLAAAVRIRPGDPNLRCDLAAVLAGSGRISDAEAHYRATLQLAPNHVLALGGLGTLLARSGRPELGLPLLQRAVEAQPAFLDARYNLGIALLAMGRSHEAIAHLALVVHQRPGDDEARSLLARAEALAAPAP